jgi:dipeptidyl aminopeptidase/acylaminoacyl peptidase
MKKSILFVSVLSILLITSCTSMKEKKEQIISRENREVPDFSKGILTEEILWYFGRVTTPKLSPDGQQLLFGVKYFDYHANKGNLELYTMPITGGEPIKITTTAQDEIEAIWRPDGKKIAYLFPDKEGVLQIWESNPDGKELKQISHEKSDITAFSYSPTQSHIVYSQNVRLDPTIAERYPDLPEANAKIYDDLMYRHWNSWADGTYSHLFVAPYPSLENPVDLLKGEKFQAPLPPFGGMEQVAWSPDGEKLAYCCKQSFGKTFAESTNSDIFIYDLKTGNTTNISSFNLGYDLDPVFSPNGNYIAWLSMEKPGFESDKKRIIIHDFNSETTVDYSTTFDYSAENLVWNDKSNTLYFLSTIAATNQIFELNLDLKRITLLTQGDHDYNSLLFAKDRLITTKTTHAFPTEIFSISLQDNKETQLTFTNQPILDKITMGKTEKKIVKTTDGKDMLVWVIYPPHFDSTKKYPTLLYCQGGPQQAVSHFFSYRWNFQMMAAHDYIIVAPNRRGLPGFGTEWNAQISGDYGGQNMKDYLSAIDAMTNEPYVDKERLGAVGASYGGYSIYWLAGNHQKRFKAFIAHCGMFNFESWYGTTEELFFANHDIEGNYWQTPKPKSYQFSPHLFVGNWDTPILVIHGSNDFRIPYTEGMQAFNAAQMQGIPSRFLFFPEEDHFVTKPQNAILWQREFFRFLDEWLKK